MRIIREARPNCRTGVDDNHHWNPVRITEHEAGYAGHLAVRHKGKMEAVSARLSEYIHECAVVLRGRHLDLAHPYLLRPHFLYYHHWHTLRKDALSTGKTGPVTLRSGNRIIYEQRRETTATPQATDGQQSLSDDAGTIPLYGSILFGCTHRCHSWMGRCHSPAQRHTVRLFLLPRHQKYPANIGSIEQCPTGCH